MRREALGNSILIHIACNNSWCLCRFLFRSPCSLVPFIKSPIGSIKVYMRSCTKCKYSSTAKPRKNTLIESAILELLKFFIGLLRSKPCQHCCTGILCQALKPVVHQLIGKPDSRYSQASQYSTLCKRAWNCLLVLSVDLLKYVFFTHIQLSYYKAPLGNASGSISHGLILLWCLLWHLCRSLFTASEQGTHKGYRKWEPYKGSIKSTVAAQEGTQVIIPIGKCPQ